MPNDYFPPIDLAMAMTTATKVTASMANSWHDPKRKDVTITLLVTPIVAAGIMAVVCDPYFLDKDREERKRQQEAEAS